MQSIGLPTSSLYRNSDSKSFSFLLHPAVLIAIVILFAPTLVFAINENGLIVVDVVTDPSGSSQVFEFTTNYGPPFMLSDTDQPIVSEWLLPSSTAGTYSVTEAAVAGWDNTNIDCRGEGNAVENPAAIDLSAGETVVCEFINTQRGSIRVVKQVTAPGSAEENFAFTGTGPAGFDFSGGFTISTSANQGIFTNSTDFTNLVPGYYSILETNPVQNGWILASAACSGGDTPDFINISPGEDVTCTFINAPLGSSTIIANSVGGEDVFGFTWGNETNTNVPEGESSTFTLDTTGDATETRHFNHVHIPNDQYDLKQTGTPGTIGDYMKSWVLTQLVCIDETGDTLVSPGLNGSDVTINSAANETVTCTFTNTLDGTLVIRTETEPNGIAVDFNFNGSVTGLIRDFSTFFEELSITGQPADGPYTAMETVPTPTNWRLDDISCVGATASIVTIGASGGFEPGDKNISVDLAAGETVICTFFNTLPNACHTVSVTGVIETSEASYEACELLYVESFTAEAGATISLSAGTDIVFGPDFLIEQGAELNANTCGLSLCEVSLSPMPYGCHSCVNQICDIDPSCCDVSFDQACLNKVDTVCELVCE
ncbi:MAG: hypothetical protein IMF09_12905 [Proteobacteria bacterium]|nr:hypothetical protein [Pseudomonadota bacterium]